MKLKQVWKNGQAALAMHTEKGWVDVAEESVRLGIPAPTTMLEAIRYVDLVIPEENWDQKRTDIHEYHIDTFVMGNDWEGKFDFLKEEGCEVVYLPRTPEISTTQIKKDMKDFNK